MARPLLLDLFCCAGGAAAGYVQAGFEVVGVDIQPQPHYPFAFVQADALAFLDHEDLSGFAVIHASPECKAYTNCNLSPRENYQKLISQVRARLIASGKPYIIENVRGATKQNELHASLMLCASMFGLPMQRHRYFESNAWLYPPLPCDHRKATIAVYGHSVWDSARPGTQRRDGRARPDSVSIEVGRAAMQCPWMNIEELAEAIPPAYTRWIGTQLLDVLAYRHSNKSENIA
jgi:DNA (cytosine-5)-methyltransferase 1